MQKMTCELCNPKDSHKLHNSQDIFRLHNSEVFL